MRSLLVSMWIVNLSYALAAGTAAAEEAGSGGRTQPDRVMVEGPLGGAARRALAELEAGERRLARGGRTSSGHASRTWAARHPMWLGTLVGAGAGVLAALTYPEFACGLGDENCLFRTGTGALLGAGGGAGAGALIGWAVSR